MLFGVTVLLYFIKILSGSRNLMWGELILIQSKNSINFDPVLGLNQNTSSGIQYYHVSKIKQYRFG
jgi:hypothetical protein